MLTVEPLTASIGAEVAGVNLADELDETVVEEIRAALLQWKVLFFRDQHDLDRARHIAFARRFGELEVHPVTPKDQAEPEVFVIPAEGKFRAPDQWHSDVTWRPQPSMGSVLRSVVLPPLGGDTLWANMAFAHELLDDATRERIADLRATHDFTTVFGKHFAPEEREKMRLKHPTVSHPVVRTHPDTGEKIVYVNQSFTLDIEGVPEDEGRRLLRKLYALVHVPDLQVRFRWRPGSVAFWDNRATQHVVSNDFLPARRVMERVTVVGDTPV